MVSINDCNPDDQSLKTVWMDFIYKGQVASKLYLTTYWSLLLFLIQNSVLSSDMIADIFSYLSNQNYIYVIL